MLIRLKTGRFNSVAFSQVGPMGATRTRNLVQIPLFYSRGLYKLEGFTCYSEGVAKVVESEFNMVVRAYNTKNKKC